MPICTSLPRLVGRVGTNDAFLAILLLYLLADMYRNHETFCSCDRPIRTWLLGTYVLTASLRGAHLIGDTYGRNPQEFAFTVSQRYHEKLLWPILAIWAVIGTVWTSSDRISLRPCLSETRHMLVVSWIFALYTWLGFQACVAFMAWQNRKHLQWVKDNFVAVEDDDVVSRWGHVSEEPEQLSLHRGLTAAEIATLPSMTATPNTISQSQDFDCPICLGSVEPGDCVRSLDSCGHTFHRACIDLWLLRRADCPLCKTSVGSRNSLAWGV